MKKEIKEKIANDIFKQLCPNWKGYKMIFPYGSGYHNNKNVEIKAIDIFKVIFKSIK